MSTNRLQPLPGGPTPPINSNTRRGSGSRSAELEKGTLIAAGSSALAGVSKDKLMKRVGELEFENQKLLSSLQKAEISIEGYKGFLSEQSGRRTHSISVQTEFLAGSEDSPQNSPGAIHEISQLTTKLDEACIRISQLKNEMAEMSKKEDTDRKEMDDLKNELNALKMNNELAEVSYKARIQTLEKDLLAMKNLHNMTNNSPAKTPKTQARSPQKASKTPEISGSTTSSLQLVSTPEVYRKLKPTKSITPSTSTPDVVDKKMLTSGTLTPTLKSLLHNKASSCKSMYDTINSSIELELSECGEYMRNCFASIISEIKKIENQRCVKITNLNEDVACLKKRISDADNQAKMHSAQLSASLEEKISQANEDLKKKFATVNTELFDEKRRTASLESSIVVKEEYIDELTTLFTTVSRELNNLHAKVNSENAAVKHMGHCRDLVRVATIREISLERDRAMSELKYSRLVIIVT